MAAAAVPPTPSHRSVLPSTAPTARFVNGIAAVSSGISPSISLAVTAAVRPSDLRKLVVVAASSTSVMPPLAKLPNALRVTPAITGCTPVTPPKAPATPPTAPGTTEPLRASSVASASGTP